MIRFIKQDEVEQNVKEESIIIVPSCLEYYYKNKYYEKNFSIYSINKFVLKNYNERKKMVNEKEAFVIMHQAFLKCKNNLLKYKEVENLDFIKDLLETYKVFYEFDFVSNNKVHDLKIIYEEYEKLLACYELISESLLIKSVIKNGYFNGKYVFLGLENLTSLQIELMKKIAEENEVVIYYDGYDERLIKKIDANYKLDNNLPSNDALVYALNDTEDEVCFVLNDISKKVLEGAKYHEFAIVCPNADTYEPYVEMIFNVPYSKKNVTGLLTYRFINVLKNILKGDFSNQNFLNLLKLDIFGVSKEVINQIDNYVYTWNLEKESFYLPFTKTCKNVNLKLVNNAKDEVINQIKYFLENVLNVRSAKAIAKEFWTYLEQAQIDETLFKLDKDGYNLLVSSLECINDYVNEIDLDEFFEVLSKLVSPVKKTSYKSDEVMLCNISEGSYLGKNYVYFLGASEDNFPGKLSLAPLINDADLKESSLVNLTWDFSSNRLSCYLRLLQNKNLVITYPKLSLDLKLTTLSSLVKGNVKTDAGSKFYNKKLMGLNYALKLSANDVYEENANEDEIRRVNLLQHRDLNLNITKQNALGLYSSSINISPSSIEVYAKCPFYFYCQYGLKLNVKEKNSFDNREIGSLVHFVLEQVITNDYDSINFSNLEEKIKNYALKYLELNDKIINNTVMYIIKLLSKNVVMIIKNMLKEKEITGFRPKYTEFKITDEALIKPVVVKLNEGILKLSGIVDRIDTFEDENYVYYRVIDYKTGGKKLRLDDCLEGLNLQMLLYLMAIKQSMPNAVLSGVLYYPALVKEQSVSRALNHEELDKSVQERLVMDGIINANEKVLEAMGSEALGGFIDVVSRGKLNAEKLFTDGDLDDLFAAIKVELKKMGNEILAGNINVSPVVGRVNACDFCKFSSICTFDKERNKARRLKNYKNSEVFEMLGGDKNA